MNISHPALKSQRLFKKLNNNVHNNNYIRSNTAYSYLSLHVHIYSWLNTMNILVKSRKKFGNTAKCPLELCRIIHLNKYKSPNLRLDIDFHYLERGCNLCKHSFDQRSQNCWRSVWMRHQHSLNHRFFVGLIGLGNW